MFYLYSRKLISYYLYFLFLYYSNKLYHYHPQDGSSANGGLPRAGRSLSGLRPLQDRVWGGGGVPRLPP